MYLVMIQGNLETILELWALYRCLKYIINFDLKMEDKKFYSGVLRGILSSDEMLVVFYNCMYFEKGEKFKELLEKRRRR